MDGFSSNFQDMLGKIQGTIWKIYVYPLHTEFFYMFTRKSVSVSNIAEKRMNGFLWFFLGKVGHEARNTLENFRDLAVNLLNPGSIFVFSGSVFLCNIMGNGWTDFHEIFMICQGQHKKQLSGLFNAWIDCFVVSYLGAVLCLCSTLR